jgi:hypothetical protein
VADVPSGLSLTQPQETKKKLNSQGIVSSTRHSPERSVRATEWGDVPVPPSPPFSSHFFSRKGFRMSEFAFGQAIVKFRNANIRKTRSCPFHDQRALPRPIGNLFDSDVAYIV